MVARDIAYQRQAESDAAVSFLGPRRPIKRLEDALELRFGNSRAAIARSEGATATAAVALAARRGGSVWATLCTNGG